MAEETIRLQKYLAERGVASRRKAEELIAAGRVTVDGRIARLGAAVDPRRATVAVDGQRVERQRGRPVVIMLHKPRGVVTTMEDRHAKRSVAELVAGQPERLFPVGRLDKDSEGLLLMTNDGALANALTHPSRHVAKLYRVTIRGGVTDEQMDRLSLGIELDGQPTLPLALRALEASPGRTVLEFTLREGRNRQIRRMCEALGLEVARLKRTAFGPLKLGMLPAGEWRELTGEELRRLREACQ
ncbi:MAG: rRNA pseudouridine synthase [Oscillospiraceae bacterium]|jgi:23S rRNA pseudouridine2605 synthase|nr:rRNA pseudouridine synthase [Oscillospiraceae bacterium]